jgi:hypothetical protein
MIFQAGGSERLRIASNGNIGIGTNNPLALLDITYAAPSLPDIRDMLNIKTDGNWGLKVQQSSSAGNIQYNVIHRYLSVDYNSLTFKGANVGIGTSNPTAKLHVEGTTRLNGTISYGIDTWHSDVLGNKKIWYGNDGRTYLLGSGSGTCFTFRRADETIIAEMYNSGQMYILSTLTQGSDSRIKMNIKDIDDNEALNLILAIEPKTYEYIDKETRGFDTVYGFIAQQVKEVIPRAIQIVSDFLPNIYKICDCEGDIIYCSIPDNVLINTEIKLIYNNKETICKILEIGEDYIRIDKELEVDNVFVYGYNVDDFHRMSKEYIYTLNVCATQILSRKIDEQGVVIKSHEDRIKDLETKMDRMLSNT